MQNLTLEEFSAAGIPLLKKVCMCYRCTELHEYVREEKNLFGFNNLAAKTFSCEFPGRNQLILQLSSPTLNCKNKKGHFLKKSACTSVMLSYISQIK